MSKYTMIATAILAGVTATVPAAAQTSDVIATQLVRSTVSWSGQTFSTENLRKTYERRKNSPIWLTNGQLNQQGEALLGELSGSYRDGLDPNEYLAGVRGFAGQLSDDDAAKLELAMSDAFLKLGLDLYSGFTTPSVSDPNIVIKRKKRDATQWLEGATATGVSAMLTTLRPRHPQYGQLRQMLAGYRSLMARGGWQPITEGITLKPGMTDARVNEMRQNLAARGYDVRGVEFADLYDEGLVDAVKHFQKRHGLASDGVAGPASFRALSVTAAQRVDQIAINLERWRWLPRDLGKAHVLVNQAGFEMFTMNGTEIYDKRRVIVGKPFHQSPMFSSSISYAEFNPTWTVPLSIAGKEMLPKIRNNPAYLVEKNYSLYSGWGNNSQKLNPYAVDWSAVSAKRFPYRIVQEPGPRNALGQVKFIFPNKFSVYLHDTPSRNLFSRTGRAFSHGCIRVDKPLDFARKLYELQGGMNPSQVTPIIESKKRKRVNFKRKMPVHLAYFTAWINEDGVPLFYEDVYKRDKLVRKFLF